MPPVCLRDMSTRYLGRVAPPSVQHWDVGETEHGDEFVVPSGTVTFLFADVQRADQFATAPFGPDQFGPDQFGAADGLTASLRPHDEIVRSVITARSGYLFSSAGNSFTAAFARASKAIEAITELRRALANAVWPGPELRVRAGLHLGEAEHRDGDYFGPAVRTAARVAAAGHAGQTLLTETVRLSSRVKGTIDLGLHVLRGVDESAHIHQLGPGRFPELRREPGLRRDVELPSDANLRADPDLVGRLRGDPDSVRASSPTARTIPVLTPGERRVLLCLCSPVLDGDTFTPPATVHAIAAELVVTESAVKQQLSRLYAKFDVNEGPDRRVRLANVAVGSGVVRLADLQSLRNT